MSISDKPIRWIPFALAASLAVAVAAPLRAEEAEAWEALTRVRDHLESRGAQEMSFEQTFVPAGFSSGETESGLVTLGLPRCARWDYSDPYPKSYLLCGVELHAWNPGESVGQYYSLERDQPGLDLLRLDRERLEATYAASLRRSEDELVIELTPRRDDGRALAGATLRIAPDGLRILGLSYVDAEGSRTEFTFDAPRPVDAGTRFEPPGGLRWERETP